MNRAQLLMTLLIGVLASPALLAAPTVELEIINHVFQPSALEIPAGQKVRLLVVNRDPTPEEFESYELNREKVIAGNAKAVIFVGPLEPGDYPFFGEFNPKTAQGVIRVSAP
ncbi:MAG: cupredoxin domain-containing protein [Luminiphilus sp.]|jgi:hypothetical protein